MSLADNKYKFCIDNGHGGMVNGSYVTAPDKMYEFEDGTTIYEGVFNREVVDLIIQKGLSKGLDVEKVVEEEHDISLSERVKRVENIKNNTYKDVIFISVHGNAFPKDNSAGGWEVYTYPSKTFADDVATEIFKEAKDRFSSDFRMRTDYSDNDPDKDAKFYLLRNTTMPSVLTENFFMTNYEECQFMLSEEGKEAIAEIHINALQKIEKDS